MHVVCVPPANRGCQPLPLDILEVHGGRKTIDLGEMVALSGVVVQHFIPFDDHDDTVKSSIWVRTTLTHSVLSKGLEGGCGGPFAKGPRGEHQDAEMPLRPRT